MKDAGAGDDTATELRSAVSEEWAFLTSLLTSPLPRHVKSSTLWWQRCWLVRHFLDDHLSPNPVAEGSSRPDHSQADAPSAFISAEIDVILRAAERHKANYHAFHYGRRILHLYPGAWSHEEGEVVVERVRRWCFAHPRDGSGWGFLAFLVRWSGLVMGDGEREGLIGTLSDQTREFVTALGWKGESVEGFLREMDATAKQSDTISTGRTVGGIG